MWAKEGKDAKTPQQKRALVSNRSNITKIHIHQKRGEKFLLGFKSMAYVCPRPALATAARLRAPLVVSGFCAPSGCNSRQDL